MIALVLTVVLGAAEPIAACHSDTAVLTVVLEGIEVDVGEDFVLRRLWTGPEGEETAPRAVLANGTVEGVSFQLNVGPSWSLRRGEEDVELRVPRAFRSDRVEILGVGAAHVWVAAPGGLARVSLSDAGVDTGRVGRRTATPLPLAVDEEALVVSGADVFQCSAPDACSRLVKLPGAVSQIVAGSGGWLLAVAGRDGGLFRVPTSLPEAVEILIAGEVRALCAAANGEAWAVMVREEEVRVVAAATDTPAVRPFTPAEIIFRGLLGHNEPEVIARALEAASERHWVELEAMALTVLNDERAVVRQQAARALGHVVGARATAGLWLLGRDLDAEVRVEALYAAAARCPQDPSMTCTQALAPFLGDADAEVAWTARDLLLDFNPRAALDQAPATYKIEAIAALVGRLQRHGDLVAERALEMLAADPEPAVRAAARMALAGARR